MNMKEKQIACLYANSLMMKYFPLLHGLSLYDPNLSSILLMCYPKLDNEIDTKNWIIIWGKMVNLENGTWRAWYWVKGKQGGNIGNDIRVLTFSVLDGDF